MKFNIRSAIALVIIIFSLISLSYLYSMIKNANKSYSMVLNQKNSLEYSLDEANKDKSALKAELDDLKNQRDGLVSKITDLESRMRYVDEEYRGKLEELTSMIDELKNKLIEKEKELPQMSAEIESLKAKIRKGEKKIISLFSRINEQKIAGHETSVNLQPITVKTRLSELNAKVLNVNSEYGFIVIDAGASAGIKTGDTLFVYRKSKLLGKVVVEKIDANVCAAKMLFKSLADEVRKGDTVSY